MFWTWILSSICPEIYTYWAKRLSNHFCMYNSVTSLSFWISLQDIITQCRLPILSILWGLSLALFCCKRGYKKLVDFQVVENGQISINLFGNIKVLPFLSKLHFESWKVVHTFLRNSHFKQVILAIFSLKYAFLGQNDQFHVTISQKPVVHFFWFKVQFT